MIIRREQMEVFENQAEREFIIRLADHLRTGHPRKTKPFDDPALLQRTRESVQTARALGVTLQDSLALFAALQFEFGRHFHLHPKVKKLLSRQPPDEAIQNIPDVMTDQDWNEAERLSAGIDAG